MLKIFASDGNVYPYDYDDTFFIIYNQDGFDTLQWDVSINHPLYKYMTNETEIEFESQRFLIKTINERSTSGVSTITAELNLDDFKSMYLRYFSEVQGTLSYFLNRHLPSGWTIKNAESIKTRRSLQLHDVTYLDIIKDFSNKTIFNARYKFDTLNKVIYVISKERNTYRGLYLTEELNISDLNFKGDSSNLVTRLHFSGKDDAVFGDVYNHDYTKKVIWGFWKDERFTDAESIEAAATEKLKELAFPKRTYNVNVIDVARLNPEKYGELLNFEIDDTVSLLDKNRQEKIMLYVTQLERHPKNPLLNKIKLESINSSNLEE